MKTYFDLEKKEKSDYRKEFFVTPGGKQLSAILKIIGAFFILIFALYIVFDITIPVGDSDYDLVKNAEKGAAAMLMILFGYGFWIDLNFAAWLKNKHNIKRW